MALKTNYAAPSTVICPEAYIRVVAGMWSAAMGTARVDANIYKDVAARQSGAEPVDRITVEFALDPSAELFTQAYAALKARPEFANATDV